MDNDELRVKASEERAIRDYCMAHSEVPEYRYYSLCTGPPSGGPGEMFYKNFYGSSNPFDIRKIRSDVAAKCAVGRQER